MAHRRSGSGVVTSFDDVAGLGVVRDDSDGHLFDFHCTAIIDGSRHIEVDRLVSFVLRAGHVGRIEAAQVTPLA
ncbi:MAG: hypothetical protein WBA45_07035 [Microthrixaceae bacterium]